MWGERLETTRWRAFREQKEEATRMCHFSPQSKSKADRVIDCTQVHTFVELSTLWSWHSFTMLMPVPCGILLEKNRRANQEERNIPSRGYFWSVAWYVSSNSWRSDSRLFYKLSILAICYRIAEDVVWCGRERTQLTRPGCQFEVFHWANNRSEMLGMLLDANAINCTFNRHYGRRQSALIAAHQERRWRAQSKAMWGSPHAIVSFWPRTRIMWENVQHREGMSGSV